MSPSSQRFQRSPRREPGYGHSQRSDDMNYDRPQRPSQPALLQRRNDFSRERGERRQAAAKAGDDEKPPFGRQVGRLREVSNRHADNIAAYKIGGQCSWGQTRQEAVEAHGKLPT